MITQRFLPYIFCPIPCPFNIGCRRQIRSVRAYALCGGLLAGFDFLIAVIGLFANHSERCCAASSASGDLNQGAGLNRDRWVGAKRTRGNYSQARELKIQEISSVPVRFA